MTGPVPSPVLQAHGANRAPKGRSGSTCAERLTRIGRPIVCASQSRGPSHGPAVARRIWPSDHGSRCSPTARNANLALDALVDLATIYVDRLNVRDVATSVKLRNEGDRLLGPLNTATRALRIAALRRWTHGWAG